VSQSPGGWNFPGVENGLLCENMTLSTNPEVHNVLQYILAEEYQVMATGNVNTKVRKSGKDRTYGF